MEMRGFQQYKEQSINTMTQGELLLLLYDELVKRLTGRNYPVFVDNMESIDDLENVRPTGQMIFAKCVSRAELSVRPVQPVIAAGPKAA